MKLRTVSAVNLRVNTTSDPITIYSAWSWSWVPSPQHFPRATSTNYYYLLLLKTIFSLF